MQSSLNTVVDQTTAEGVVSRGKRTTDVESDWQIPINSNKSTEVRSIESINNLSDLELLSNSTKVNSLGTYEQMGK